ncbi:MAG: hypothetical protein A2Z14_17815 [Chloroflexi bacterium RBG_16_48_8]|nr:MAG: hypothetical protein A2Z14_17815 [Chloroflexi bacterium RBG_16_48_8]
MSINTFLPFLSSAIMLVFTVSVLKRYLLHRKPHFLFWGIGLAMFGVGSFAEAYFSAVGWSAVLFFGWYLFGAALNAAWIGHGTLMLLVRKRWRNYVTVLLLLGSIIATFLMLQVMPLLDVDIFEQSLPISEQYRHILPAIDEGATIRLSTPFFNIYGLIALVGGAIWSAWLFLRKRVLPNRVIGNVLIAAGALSIGFASTLTRLGIGTFLYVGELIAAVLMYAGFVVASAPATETERRSVPEASPALSVEP